VSEPADFEVHLATCAQCAGELARYREVLHAVGSLRDVLDEPPPGLPERVIAGVLGEDHVRWPAGVARLLHDRRAHVAAASLGGALVGAGAMALLWWRVMKRAVATTGV
jgi:anti-sigma factor RsiW